MSLHPEAAAFLDRLAEQRMPPFEQVDVPTVRELMSGLRQAQGPAEPVESITETHVPGPAGPLPVRVYRPSRRPGPCPLLVFFHGGGWVAGDLELVDKPLRSLANTSGAVVASVEYRRAPETRFPGPADDAYAAIGALAARAEEFGADAGRLVVAGESAGGNLAAAAGLMARDRGGPAIDLLILICPSLAPADGSPFASYDQYAEGFLNTRAAMAHFWDLYLPTPEAATDPYAAPLLADDLGGLPPTVILTAECDPLRDEAEEYGRRLRGAGVPAVTRRYDGALHVFFLLPGFTAARQARDDITRALRTHFRD
ncbi:alpha/beta hydrolase [Streptomyces piniterrae]|uniref:Alpha/beta hydrolase n=1 Tax=Streptomyces piniterrae TaxID=2571125 RepID=A0A4U0NYF9_9ACTN|nr:alpha/beta hydrolase [Streptomyces piniterrae]TJZ59242.1 alpha/beta hydrolase [Streptomyces piniterrae]